MRGGDDVRGPRDEASEKLLRAQAGTVLRQRAALGSDRRAGAFQEVLSRRVQSRRKGREDVEQFDVVRDGSPGGTAVVRGALLVRTSLREADPGLFDELVATCGGVATAVDDRVAVLRGNDLSPHVLRDLAQRVRSAGHEASLDHIVPLGPIVKGEGGPGLAHLGWRRGTPSPDRPGVAVIDTGAAVEGREHVWQQGFATAAPDDVDPLDAFSASGPGPDGLLDAAAGHGAFAIGVVQQVDPGGRPRPYRAMDSDGIGSEVSVAEALLRAVRDGAEVVNLSLGAQTLDDQPLLAVQVALEVLDEDERFRDVLLVAAAGNFGDRRPVWPAAFRRVVAVGALTAELAPAPWSSRGHWVDVSCVGEGVVSTYVRGEEDPALSPGTGHDVWDLGDPTPWAVWSGTSFAAPQVAGEVCRRLAEARASDLTATPRQVYVELLREGTRLPDLGIRLSLLPGTPLP